METINIKIDNKDILEDLSVNGFGLERFSKKERTYEMCKVAVCENGACLYLVPKKYRTLEICKIAVKDSYCAIEYVPIHLYKNNKELIDVALESNAAIALGIFEKVKIITDDIYTKAVRIMGLALKYIPVNLKTKELCEIAFKQDNTSLRYFPEEFVTREHVIEALKNDKTNCMFLNIKAVRKHLDEEIASLAINANISYMAVYQCH